MDHDSRDEVTRQTDAIAMAIGLLLFFGRVEDAAMLLSVAKDRQRVLLRLEDAERSALGEGPAKDSSPMG